MVDRSLVSLLLEMEVPFSPLYWKEVSSSSYYYLKQFTLETELDLINSAWCLCLLNCTGFCLWLLETIELSRLQSFISQCLESLNHILES